jgi:hypothetical protein
MEMENGAELAETTVKRCLCCGFRHTVKAMELVHQCLWRICREINVFPMFEYQCFMSFRDQHIADSPRKLISVHETRYMNIYDSTEL